jgi:hypothetical protein
VTSIWKCMLVLNTIFELQDIVNILKKLPLFQFYIDIVF